jgi:Do/DeqQ family serine protease
MAKEIQFRRSTAILTLLAASLGGGVIAALMVASRSSGPPVEVTAEAAGGTGVSPSAPSASYADMLEKVTPAVVSVNTTQVIKSNPRQSPFFMDPFFQQFFGQGFGQQQQEARPRSQKEYGLGSGVIVSKDGYILTNNHVVNKASDIEVQLLDGRKIKAKVVGTDKDTDVAVLKITAQDLPTVHFGDSAKARVGDLVFAIGNPFGVGQTVTMGIVSAKSRGMGGRIEHFEDFIQTDASINPGNSGGALVNANGDVVGINTAILANGSEGNQGIGFAIPINLVRNVMDQLIKSGKVTRGYMGAILQNVTADLEKQFNLPSAKGALVSQIEAGKPAAQAGLKVGDFITAINGQAITDANDAVIRIIQMSPGAVAHLDVLRNGKTMKIDITLGTRPADDTVGRNFSSPGGQGGNTSDALKGVTVETLTPEIAQQVNVPASTKGVVVDSVDQDSAAAEALQRGDVIVQVDRQPVTNEKDYERLVQQAKGDSILLLINRGGSNVFVAIPSK